MQSRPQFPVGCNAAAGGDAPDSGSSHRSFNAVHEHPHGGVLERGSEILRRPWKGGVPETVQLVHDGCLESRKRHVVLARGVGQPRTWKRRRPGISRFREPVDDRPTGISGPQKHAHLVVRLATRVVDRGPQYVELVVAPAHGEHRVAPRHQKNQIGILESGCSLFARDEVRGVRVRFHMVDCDERKPRREGVRLGEGESDGQRAAQPRTVCDRNGIDGSRVGPRFQPRLR